MHPLDAFKIIILAENAENVAFGSVSRTTVILMQFLVITELFFKNHDEDYCALFPKNMLKILVSK